jgi:hypothetical protein
MNMRERLGILKRCRANDRAHTAPGSLASGPRR